MLGGAGRAIGVSLLGCCVAALVLLTAEPLAAGRSACGPPGARTIASNQQARVYVGGRDAILGCHRAQPRGHPLGNRARVRLVRLAGRYAAVVQSRTGGRGERLALYDLRRGRRSAIVRFAGADKPRARFTRIRLDRRGLAAYVVRFGASAQAPASVEVGSTVDGAYAWRTDIDPSFLGLAAKSVAYRRGDTFVLEYVEEDRATDGTLIRAGDVRVVATDGRTEIRTQLFARLDAERTPVRLGTPTSACASSSGCAGIDALQVAGRFVAVRDQYYDTGESGGEIRVYDLASGERRTTCRSPGRFGGVGAFVLTETGGVACVVAGDHGDSSTLQVCSEEMVLDQGPGIDLDALSRRGDQLVWLHDGVERTAPLPVHPGRMPCAGRKRFAGSSSVLIPTRRS